MKSRLLEKHEEVLEVIWRLEEDSLFEVEKILLALGKAYSMGDLIELQRMDLIRLLEEQAIFTKTGKAHAEGIIRRHRLTEVLLHSILKIRNGRMNEIACEVEHTLVPEVEAAICTLLGHPESCPNGRPIPRGSCCVKRTTSVGNLVFTLDELTAGESGKVSFIKPISHSQLRQLLSLGLNPGVVVGVHRTTPAFCIRFDNTELALDKDVARNIFVVKIPK